MASVGAGANTAAYSYLANSDRVGQIDFINSGSTNMTTTKAYDGLNRLTQISSSTAATNIAYAYDYSAEGRRRNATLANGDYWEYAYDNRGQVVIGNKQGGDTLEYSYTYDDIGNRESATNLPSNTYDANLLNQYTNIVTDGQATNLVYDEDGNLTDDGKWSYTWNGDNRLIRMENANKRLTFKYDCMGRRIRKRVLNRTYGIWWLNYSRKYVYDLPGGQSGSWNVVAELDRYNNVVRTYMWGKDLSGTLNGAGLPAASPACAGTADRDAAQAGGVGGLLGVNDATQGFHFVAYDGNGNVMALVDADAGTVSAEYEYGPFGEVIRATGPMADNPIRFSTKYQDDESGLVYYGRRFYSPDLGRWPNRDPLGEPGFELLRGKQALASAGEPNRYLFVKNNPLQNIEPDGLDLITITYTNGTTVTYGTFSSPNMGQLMGALTNAAGSISGITIKGHACCTIQSFGDDLITMDSTGTKILGTDGTDVAGALKSALAPGAWIYLAGCGSGRGTGNIAQQMSAVLPGVTVSGHQGVAALNVPFCGCAIGKRNYYINGTLQHSAW